MSRVILIIDDDLTMQRIITLMLSAEDFQIAVAANVADGFKTIDQQIPDLILCDVMMPGADGLDFIWKCRQMPELNAVPIISISASSEGELIEQAIKRGSFAFLSKPFSAFQLLEMVTLALQDRS